MYALKLLKKMLKVVYLGPHLKVLLISLDGFRGQAHVGHQEQVTSSDRSLAFFRGEEKPGMGKTAAESIGRPSASNHSSIFRQRHTFQFVRTELKYGAAVSSLGLERRAHVTPPSQGLLFDSLATEFQISSLRIFPKLSIKHQQAFFDGRTIVAPTTSPDKQLYYGPQQITQNTKMPDMHDVQRHCAQVLPHQVAEGWTNLPRKFSVQRCLPPCRIGNIGIHHGKVSISTAGLALETHLAGTKFPST